MSGHVGDDGATTPSDDVKAAERPRRIDASGILEDALDGLDEVPDELATALLAELGTSGSGRAQRLQEAIESAGHG